MGLIAGPDRPPTPEASLGRPEDGSIAYPGTVLISDAVYHRLPTEQRTAWHAQHAPTTYGLR